MSGINDIDGFCDAAWEEYLSTGIDPTGGELGPDFDPETGRLLSEIEEEEAAEEEEPDYEPDPDGTLMDHLDRLETLVDARVAELKRKAANLKKQ